MACSIRKHTSVLRNITRCLGLTMYEAGNGPLDASGRNGGLGKSRNNKAKESDEDRPVYPNCSNLSPNHGQRDRENALNRRARTILGCQHVFPQNRRMACEEHSTLA